MKSKTTWEKFSKFAADFETTAHKEFTDEEILNENRQTFAEVDSQVDFTPNSSSKVFLAGLMSLKDYSYKLSFENIAEFINNIAIMTYKEHHNRAVVYFHNLAYDGSYLLNWLLQHGWKQTLAMDPKTFKPLILRKQFSLLASGGKFFNLTLWWRGIEIHFLDSLKLFPQSLASLGQTIGYKKLKETVDYKEFEIKPNHDYPEEWLVYLKRDCEILAHYLNAYFEQEEKSHTLKRQTIGSIAYSYVKGTIEKLTPNFTIKDYRLFENWFHGGLTFPSFKHWAKWVYKPKKIFMIDACSMYPSQMVKMLPYGKPLKVKPKEPHCAFYKIHIKSAIIKDKYNDIATMWKPFEMQNGKKVLHMTKFNTNYQYIQEIEDEVYYYTDIELELIEKLYDIKYEILDTWYFLKSDYLKDIITEMFQAKKIAKEKGDPVGKMLAKLKINNIYGKTAQKPNRTQDYYGSLDSISDKYLVHSKKNIAIESYNIEKLKEEDTKASPIFLGAYITAMARVSLLSMYMYIVSKGGKFLYCDTDSICFINPKKDIKFPKMIGNDLGLWEFEEFTVYKLDSKGNYLLNEKGEKIVDYVTNAADGFCSLCPKQYRIVVKGQPQPVKLASAGVKKELMKKVANQDYNYDLGDNKKYHIIKTQLKNSINGKVIWDSPFNFTKWKKLKSNPKCPKELKWEEK